MTETPDWPPARLVDRLASLATAHAADFPTLREKIKQALVQEFHLHHVGRFGELLRSAMEADGLRASAIAKHLQVTDSWVFQQLKGHNTPPNDDRCRQIVDRVPSLTFEKVVAERDRELLRLSIRRHLTALLADVNALSKRRRGA